MRLGAGLVRARGEGDRKIIINHSYLEEAWEIRLKLLKLIAGIIKEEAEYYGEGETEQCRNIRQNKQG